MLLLLVLGVTIAVVYRKHKSGTLRINGKYNH